jgi:hypothetical protein
MALVYSLIYFLIAFLIFSFSFIYFKKIDLLKAILFSFFIGMLMFVVYLIKWEIIHFKKQGKHGKAR